MSLYVLNSSGAKEPFSGKKIYRSARRSGVPSGLAKDISRAIEKEAYSGIKTVDIHRKVKRLLSRQIPRSAIRFNLKEGMKKLGPTGFPFEKYIAEILSKRGYSVKINQHVSGRCIRYEIDFLAKKGKLLYIGECKYRRHTNERVNTNIALMNYARFLDIKNGNRFRKEKIESLLVTNTKFTNRAIRYSRCVGAKLLGWNYPRNKGLEYLIESQKLYPITILPSLRGFLINIFVSKRMMLAKDLLKVNPQIFAKKEKIPLNRLLPLIKEAKILLEE